ncbi:MAG TPA: CrcB family protein [Oligoflexia bacterium]|nr:CrcB family protein [Oligoflexia bacterium]HMR24837.1 CrcB family protein [Oligoflexia bacterium]
MKVFNFLAVCAGGALGASVRYGLELLGAHLFSWSNVLSIALVNILGCFLFALLSSWLKEQWSVAFTLFVFTGFLGGMTTFSSFIAHSHMLISMKQLVWAAVNISAQVFLGLLAFYVTQKLLA